MFRRPLFRLLCASVLASVVAIAGVRASAFAMQDGHNSIHSIRHVFVITLENKDYSSTFGNSSTVPYLSQTLAKQGALLTQYYGTGHASLDNYIAMLSGQSATRDTSADCNTYSDLQQTGVTADGQVIGTGCVYPESVKTLADQLTEAGLTWKGYMGDMGNDPAREPATCGHPTLNTRDMTQRAEGPSPAVPQGDMYATRHDPFMYFHSIIDSPQCSKKVVNLSYLQADLRSVETTANFNFITPSLCDDGHDAPCADGRPGGYASIDIFLQKIIPMIQESAAYKEDGLIIINFDEGSFGHVQHGLDGTIVTIHGDTCCGEQPGPNLAAYPVITSRGAGEKRVTEQLISFGGERTGAVLLSRFIKPGTVSNVPYNHYSLLRSLEDIFEIHNHLGYASQEGLVDFGSDIFTAM